MNELLAAQSFDRAEPANLRPSDREFFAALAPLACPAIAWRRIENAAVNGNGEILLADDVDPSSFLDHDHFDRRDRKRYRRRAVAARQSPRRLAGEFLWIADRHSHNHHHWLADTLPRLEAWLLRHDRARLLLPERILHQPFVRACLDRYPQAELVEPAVDMPVVVETLIVPDKVAPPTRHHDLLIRHVAERLSPMRSDERARASRRLYVSRQAARFRRVANEAEILPVLSRWGFETIMLEDLDFEEQTAMVGQAECLAGPHGAGLVNMMFMKSGGAVLEMRWMEGSPLCFHDLSGACGHAWYYMSCQPTDPLMHPHVADLNVCAQALDSVLSGMFG